MGSVNIHSAETKSVARQIGKLATAWTSIDLANRPCVEDFVADRTPELSEEEQRLAAECLRLADTLVNSSG